jgi:hypothetical protein
MADINAVTKTREEIDARITLFVEALSKYCNEKNICAHIYSYVFEVQIGPKNARIVRKEKWPEKEPTAGSVHCFIRLEDGAILKAGGWKAPAKNPVRGSIFAEGFDIGEGRAVNNYGCTYLR